MNDNNSKGEMKLGDIIADILVDENLKDDEWYLIQDFQRAFYKVVNKEEPQDVINEKKFRRKKD